MTGSPGDNVWYGRTNFVRIRRYESALRRYVFKHNGSTIVIRCCVHYCIELLIQICSVELYSL